jgi:hypothetical protein
VPTLDVDSDRRTDDHDEEPERDPLRDRVEVFEQSQFDEEPNGPKENQREQHPAQRTVVVRRVHSHGRSIQPHPRSNGPGPTANEMLNSCAEVSGVS